jgi:NADH-quinone oxidoreductase subunit L
MKLPLIVLTLLSIGAGFIPFSQFVSSDSLPFETHLHLAFSVAPVVLVIIGIGLAWYLYKNASDKPEKISVSLGSLYRGAYRKFYIDEIYLFITRNIIYKMIGKPAAQFDRNVVDGGVNGIGNGTQIVSEKIKTLQNGRIQHYVLVFFAGVLILSILFVWLW